MKDAIFQNKVKATDKQESVTQRSYTLRDNRQEAVTMEKLLNSINTDSGGYSLQMKRPKNPAPAPNATTEAGFTGITLSEHHIIPYKKLESFLDLYLGTPGSYASLSGFIPADANITAAELAILGIITKEAKQVLETNHITPDGWTTIAEADKTTHLLSIEDETLRPRAKESLDLWKTSVGNTRNGRAPEKDILAPYVVWSKANLFVGPEARFRTWDPKDSFDKWGKYFATDGRYPILKKISKEIDTATGELSGDTPPGEHTASLIAELNKLIPYNKAILFDATKWIKPNAAVSKWKPVGAP